MTQFQEGQEVEVRRSASARDTLGGFKIVWRKAKIVYVGVHPHGENGNSRLGFHPAYTVELPDGTREVFDASSIRPAQS